MNIILFTQDDPFYIKVFFQEFLSKYESLSDIKAIVISRPMGKKNIVKLAQQMYDFYGLADFIRMGMKYAYIRIMSHKRLRKKTAESLPKTYSLKQLADSFGIKVIERSDLNSESFLGVMKSFNPDLFISVAAPIIFKEDLINIPKLDCINIHNSPLPKYRGMLPNFWQMFHGEESVGVTVHKIDKGIDTGDIIRQDYVPIEPADTLNDLIIKTKKYDAKMIIEIIKDYNKGSIQYKKMEGKGSYFSFPTHKDVAEFKKRGKRLL